MNLKKLLKCGTRYCTNRQYRFGINTYLGFYDAWPDERYIKKAFLYAMGSPLNLESPRTFNEKLQWLKLYDHDPRYTEMVDKLQAKLYVERTIGAQYVIPTLGVWNSVQEIDWDTLPQKFVLKVTHDSGGTIVCTNKAMLNKRQVQKKLQAAMKHDYYLEHREWPYKDVKRRILAEEFLEGNQGAPPDDYKIHCFNGHPEFVLVCRDRFGKTGMTEDFFDLEWNHIPVKRPDHPNAQQSIKKPENLEKMLELAAALSSNIPFLRVDLYEIGGSIYFGELTFFPATGLKRFIPDEYDTIWGQKIILPQKRVPKQDRAAKAQI